MAYNASGRRPRGGAAGDLYIFLSVKDDPTFLRDGVDVSSALEVSAADAALARAGVRNC